MRKIYLLYDLLSYLQVLCTMRNVCTVKRVGMASSESRDPIESGAC